MASFVYYYKTAGNERHSGEIDAPDREAAFALLRERGIRAIKVEPKGWETGRGYRGVKKRVVAALVLAVAAVIGVAAYLLGRGGAADVRTVVLPQGTVTLQTATPLERQRILGDRVRIENFPTNLFRHAAEAALARFAEPGRPVPQPLPPTPTDAEFRASRSDPVRIASNDLTEHIDLKRIVAGMKRELSAYVDGGGTVEGYFAELVKRQRMEIAYRDRAEARLKGLLSAARTPQTHEAVLGNAYAYWLKANASLQAMGIHPLELPQALRKFQLSLDIDDEEGVPTIESRTVESPPVARP